MIAVTDDAAARDILGRDDAPSLAILDWMMPELDGVEVCRLARQAVPSVRSGPREDSHRCLYLILLTARGEKEDIVAGLEPAPTTTSSSPSIANNRARLNVGLRMVELQHRLARRVAELNDALGKVKHLQGLLPICSYCKCIRDDRDYWQQVESYIGSHTAGVSVMPSVRPVTRAWCSRSLTPCRAAAAAAEGCGRRRTAVD